MNHDVLILYSGGADSRLLLEFAKKTGKVPYCLLVDYGQLHKEELEFAKKQILPGTGDYQVVSITGLNINSALTGSGKKGTFKDVSIWNVPGRNTIFLSLALSIAESKGINKIWIGCDFSDRLGLFPDCYSEYIVKMRDVLQVAGSRPIELEAPLLGLTKDMVLDLLKSYGIEKEDLFSGYGEL